MIGALVLAAALAAFPPLRPDPALTAGVLHPAADSRVTQANIAETICVPGYTAKVRHVTAATKRAIFAAYHIDPKSGRYEIDHLCSLELGCTNDPSNLWPQAYFTEPLNAHVKDALEDRLHELVCSGNVALAQAQADISSDWIAAYVKYVGALPVN